MTRINALETTYLPPASERAEAVVVFLHGHGNNATQLLQFASSLKQSLPTAGFYLPNAPDTVEEGMASHRRWFSLETYDRDIARNDAEGRATMLAAVPQGIAQGGQRLNEFLDQILAHHNLIPNRLALVGFSQGAMLSLYAGLRRLEPLAGILSYAGAIFATRTLSAEIRSRPQVLLVHGQEDHVVPLSAMTDASAMLETVGVPYYAYGIPGLRHGINNTAGTLGTAFLLRVLGYCSSKGTGIPA